MRPSIPVPESAHPFAKSTLPPSKKERSTPLKKKVFPSKTHRRPELARGRKVPHKRHELVLPAPVRRQLHAPDEPDLDAGVLEALARRRGDANLRILSFFLVEVEVKVEKKKRERAENDGKTIAMEGFSSSLSSSPRVSTSLSLKRLLQEAFEEALHRNKLSLTSPAIGSPLEYSGSSSGSTLLPLPLTPPDELELELELLRGLTATFCLGLPSDGGFRSSWMVAPCVRPRLLKMFCVILERGRGKGKGKKEGEGG